MISVKKIFFILICFLACSASKAQKAKEIEFTADRMKYDRFYKGGAQRLIGNVVFRHEGTTMTCDSAYKFSDNTMEGYEHIVIRKGDSLTITGNSLKYDGNTKLAVLEGNVVCIEKDMTLTTNIMTYDVSQSLASYLGGGTIVSKNNTLTSRNGYYHSPTKELSFRYNVKLVNPKYTMLCDTLRYNTFSKTAFFLGPTTVNSKQDKIYCESGWYDTQAEKSHLTKNASVISSGTELKGDSIYYDRKKGYGRAMSNVSVIDTIQNMIIQGDLALYHEFKGTSLVTGHTLFTRIMEKDSLFLTADTLFTINKKGRADTLKNGQLDSATVTPDTTTLKAFHHIRIYKKDLQGMCDSLTYYTGDSTMTMYRSPLLWSGASQLTAKEIKVITGAKSVKYFELSNNALIISQVDSLPQTDSIAQAKDVKYNQLKGKDIKGYFVKDTIDHVDITGNAQAVYYMKSEKKKLIGLNRTDCSSMHAFMKKGELNRVTFVDKPVSTIFPIAEVNPDEHRLKGFAWYGHKRPKSKEELLK